jgi:hypothetical protein
MTFKRWLDRETAKACPDPAARVVDVLAARAEIRRTTATVAGVSDRLLQTLYRGAPTSRAFAERVSAATGGAVTVADLTRGAA